MCVCLRQLNKIIHLDLSYNVIMELPESFNRLDHLTYLDLSHNELTVLPEQRIDALASVLKLNLSSNHLMDFPIALCFLYRLVMVRTVDAE